MEDKTMITTAEAAKFLGFKLSYLYKMMHERKVPFYKSNGKRCFFDRAELTEWRKFVRVTTAEEAEAAALYHVAINK